MIMAERYLFEFDLCCASAIKRRTVIECLRLHERYERAAQNQHNIRVFKQRIPDLLHNGRECRIGLPDILELVEHDYFFVSVLYSTSVLKTVNQSTAADFKSSLPVNSATCVLK